MRFLFGGLFGKSLYYVLLHEMIMKPRVEGSKIEKPACKDEFRWQVVKAMIDEFPNLKRKVKDYVR